MRNATESGTHPGVASGQRERENDESSMSAATRENSYSKSDGQFTPPSTTNCSSSLTNTCFASRTRAEKQTTIDTPSTTMEPLKDPGSYPLVSGFGCHLASSRKV
jgi:hypothetical protein